MSLALIFSLAACSSGESSAQTTKREKNLFPDNSGLYPIIQDSLFGYINTKGEVVIKPQFEKAAQFSEGLAYFEKDGKYGFINTKGEVVIEPVYTKKSRGWLKLAIEPLGETYFKEGLAAVNKNGLFGYIDKKGQEVIPAQFSEANAFSQGFAYVRNGQQIYFINQKGEKQFGRDFEWTSGFNDSLALVMTDQKVGYINTSGKWVIPNKYYTGGIFMDGYAAVKDTREGKTWKLIDKKGKVLFEKEADRMHKGFGNYVYFNEGRNEGLLDLKGQVVIPAKYDVLFFLDEVIIVKTDSKEDRFGLINKKGEWVTEAKYHALFPAGDNMILMGTENRELGYIDFSGKVIWKPTK